MKAEKGLANEFQRLEGSGPAHTISRMMFSYSHGAVSNTAMLGVGMLYYALTFSLPAKSAVVLGSGGGFVPAIVRQAQRDRFGESSDSSSLRVVDANWRGVEGLKGVDDFSPAEMLSPESAFRKHYPEIEILQNTSAWAVRQHFANDLVDYLHVDIVGAHGMELLLATLADWLPHVHPSGIITVHDTTATKHHAGLGIEALQKMGFAAVKIAFDLSILRRPSTGALSNRPVSKSGHMVSKGRWHAWISAVFAAFDSAAWLGLEACLDDNLMPPLSRVSLLNFANLPKEALADSEPGSLVLHSLVSILEPELAACWEEEGQTGPSGLCRSLRTAQLSVASHAAETWIGKPTSGAKVDFLHIAEKTWTKRPRSILSVLEAVRPGGYITVACKRKDCRRAQKILSEVLHNVLDMPCLGLVVAVQT
eukprot:TRINITY_DN34004_c0_g1_i1.p1 TRINITY_DN34004_c0_g1~~TRINITY_DN34004_c0_g1_i1.p1  ORF type:complete len:422 (+),score=73.66 TRINITY_DN34004_c0_g1_i1:2-1267(+)